MVRHRAGLTGTVRASPDRKTPAVNQRGKSMKLAKTFCATLLGATLLSGGAGLAAELKIGVVGPLTGPAATSGIAMRDSYQFVVDAVNADGGLDLNGEKTTVATCSPPRSRSR
jgi:ABC-type branched-subunit amino acid transport system substrate-binding protein